jgi:Nif-specific regulatory protein
MLENQALNPSKLEELSSFLLSTLDEKVFFPKLGEFFLEEFQVDQVLIKFVREDDSCQAIALNGDYIKNGKIEEKGSGAAGHVVRTRRPYFSNSVESDPLFADSAKSGIRAELVIPVTQEGIVMATMHFRQLKSEINFSREDVNKIDEVLKGLQAPLVNMKMYLSAKLLNESLLKQIELKEKEISTSTSVNPTTYYSQVNDKTMVANSQIMKEVLGIAGKVCQSHVAVMITGSKGVGKATLAQKIHCRGIRKEGPYFSIDCSSMSEEQLERELFGEENISSLDTSVKIGLLEKANGGTLLIEEIDRLSPSAQVKLSNFLNEKLAFRLNGTVPFKSNVRIISTTSRSLEEKVQSGEYRDELYLSLTTVKINFPDLKDRKDDIEELATHFLNLDKDLNQQKTLSPGAIEALKTYSWPGNVRELHNVVERAYILSDGMVVEKSHLSEHLLQEKVEEEQEEQKNNIINFTGMTLDELEKHHICMMLEHLGGNKTKTAKSLGITVKTLYNKLHSYGVIAEKN